MSDLNLTECRKLERIFCMGDGYVLNFSDRTFRAFFDEHTSVDIDADKYREQGNSKAKRLRAFWSKDGNHVVGKVIAEMIRYGQDESCLCRADDIGELTETCWKIGQRLLLDTPVVELDALSAPVDEKDFELIAREVRSAIDNNTPEAGLDRLHTFAVKYVRILCQQRGIEVTRDKALHSIFGEYVKALRAAGSFESEMTERIVKSSISVLESFNDVRNNKSLAHDNPLLNYEESLLIFNHVASSIRFIKALESRLVTHSPSSNTANLSF